ncbi:DUF4352 domain-containing protein [Paraliobacillus sediminis]|uniref:DUF4352 domain-containing protein n=1 Tax=Paraliobacillus sediminis TaxID=1885916 RepID=UPI000E3B5C94|nr:DUF4352 domain-containing protein [Paraliobacillus sediminis]
MKNLIKLMVIGMVIGFVLVGCNNDDEANETSDNQVTEDSTEVTGEDYEAEEAEGDESASDESDSSSDSKLEILSLGETGIIKDSIGTYEITPTSFELLEATEEAEPSNGVFVLINLTIKNIGDESVDSSGLVNDSAALIDSDDIAEFNEDYYKFVDAFDGEVESGEEISGQLLFDQAKTDNYSLMFGYGLETVSNQIKWGFSAEEAK